MLTDLRESEKRYSDVFQFSPLPMWIVNLHTLKFIDVNRATTEHYGYSRDEFLTMTLRDIRPPAEQASLQKGLTAGKKNPDAIANRIMIHQKKNGELIDVEIQIAPYHYKGAKNSIVIANDVTKRLQYLKAIEAQNEKLVAISWMQSHVIRAPLARIMGLIPLIKDFKTKQEQLKMLEYLSVSADELDEVIRNITDVTSVVAV